MEKVLGIYGASGHGREMLELAQIINGTKKRWSQLIFIDDGDVGTAVNEIPVYRFEDAKNKYGSALEAVMGIGEPETRRRLFEKLKANQIAVPTLIHPDVHIPESAKIGQGVVIQTGCFISSNVEIADFVLVQPNASVCHDDVLGEGCVVSGFCNLAGAVHIGRYAYLGLSASVKQCVRIGEYAIIGMGTVVLHDIEDEMVVMGNPARVARRNETRRVFG